MKILERSPAICCPITSPWPTVLLALLQSICSSLFCPIPGITWCQILEGHLEEAEHQLEFLKEVQQSLGKSEVRALWGLGLFQDGVPTLLPHRFL